MTPLQQEHATDSVACTDEGFSLALSRTEARRQVWICAGVSSLILAALLATVLAGTA